jgi:hypothetical protein
MGYARLALASGPSYAGLGIRVSKTVHAQRSINRDISARGIKGKGTTVQRYSSHQRTLPKGKGFGSKRTPKRTYISKSGTNYGGYKRLNSTQKAGLTSDQRRLYSARRGHVLHNRASTAVLAGSAAAYLGGKYLKRIQLVNQATGQKYGKITYVLGGIKKTGSYWTHSGKKFNAAVRIPRVFAQRTPGRKTIYKQLAKHSGGYRTNLKNAGRTFNVAAKHGGHVKRHIRVRRGPGGKFAGSY